MRNQPAGLAIILFCVCLPGLAFAQDETTAQETSDLGVKISVEECADADLGELLSKLKIESSTLTPELADWLNGIQPEVSITCTGNLLAIRVIDPESKHVFEQKVLINEAVSLAMARYLALTVVELLEASEEALVPSTPKPEPESEPQPEPQIESETSSFGLNLTIAPILWFGGSPLWLSYGGHLGLEISILDWLVPTVDLELSYGRSEVSIGEVTALQFSVAPLLLFRLPVPHVSLLLGFGFRMGGVALEGQPNNENDASGVKLNLPWHGPCGDLRVSFFTGNVVQLGIDAQGGWYSYEAHAEVDNTRELSLKGGWFRIGLIGKFRLF